MSNKYNRKVALVIRPNKALHLRIEGGAGFVAIACQWLYCIANVQSSTT